MKEFFSAKHFSRDNNQSDSQVVGYGDFISKLFVDSQRTKTFRRKFEYRKILEHVSYQVGVQYLARIIELNVASLDSIIKLSKTDNFGSPRKYYYRNVGWISPTLLRYVSVFSEIEKSIGFGNVKSIVEIGVGYGGQARVIHALTGIEDYAFYDLRDVQNLAQQFLESSQSALTPRNLDINNVKQESFDLVISNYALSELPALIQLEYVQKLIGHADHCYMIMNSGGLNNTGRSDGKLAQSEFLALIAGARVFPEIPLTGPDNYVIKK
jgi:putative sugar O-methyltransferase